MTSTQTAPPSQVKKPSRPGSSTSTKQIVQTVKDGRKVYFKTVVGDISGYVAGMDDYHWMVVTPAENLTTHLVHKSAPLISLGRASTYQDEDTKEEMDKIIAPFRQWVLRTYFGRSAN
jgi:hypothetical protein